MSQVTDTFPGRVIHPGYDDDGCLETLEMRRITVTLGAVSDKVNQHRSINVRILNALDVYLA